MPLTTILAPCTVPATGRVNFNTHESWTVTTYGDSYEVELINTGWMECFALALPMRLLTSPL